ncbi:MAG: hypothetical protein IT303_18875 [Dehalococcoidia bacterium]|nr:hypothetical protein [Dehalococcoidia bacterium]
MIEIYVERGEWMKREYVEGEARVESTRLPSRVPASDVMRAVAKGPTRQLVVVVGPSW